ncbi:MAG: TlpA disulfide reductase family protein [Sulfurimonas sp.]|nr:TlpA disulfide reductase family protein [Sulfurimonas sp.]
MKKIVSLFLISSALFANSLEFDPDKTYVVSFFASWCGSCKKEIPQLSRIASERKDIEIIGVDVDKDPQDAQKFQEELKEYFTFRVINDSSNEIIKEYKPIGMPALYIVQNKQVCAHIFGAVDDLKATINEALQNCKESK